MSPVRRNQPPSGILDPARRAEAEALREREGKYEQSLGRMLMRAGFLEYLVHTLCGNVLRLDSEQAAIVTKRMGFSGVCKLTVSLVDTWSRHPVQSDLRKVLRDAIAAMQLRNEMAHAMWATWEKSPHHLRFLRAEGREVPVSEIDDLTERLNASISEVMRVSARLGAAQREGKISSGSPEIEE